MQEKNNKKANKTKILFLFSQKQGIMFTNAMSSVEGGQSTEAPCLHGSECALASFDRANARERDGAERSRATLRAYVRQGRGSIPVSETKQSAVEQHCEALFETIIGRTYNDRKNGK